MKVYVTARFRDKDERKHDIDALSKAVRDAGFVDYVFVLDEKKFNDPKELWEYAYDELRACDMVLIDVSDYPSGGRLVEAGMAFALRKPLVIAKKQGVKHKELFDGIASTIIEYKDYVDLSEQLKKYDDKRNFNVTDRVMLLLAFLLPGIIGGWFLSLVFVPLGIVSSVIYWFIMRRLVPSVRSYDRLVIYIPLTMIWAFGFYLLMPLYLPAALAWLALYWVVTLLALDNLKFSL